MSERVRVSRVAIKTEVIPRSSGSVGTVYKVFMTAPPSPVVYVCDLEFKYVAEKDLFMAEIIGKDAQSYSGIRGFNWFEEAAKPLVSFRNGSYMHVTKPTQVPEIEKIEFNEPATIIFWKDGTKSVVQARDGEPYDAEKGIAMAIAKKALGNERDYYNTFIHWIKRYKKKEEKR